MAEAKSDVRAAIEWAWAQYDNCVIRDTRGIAQSIDFDKATTDDPPGGKQFLDLAFTNRVAFYKDFVLKALGADVNEDDEIAIQEKKSLEDLRKSVAKFRESDKTIASDKKKTKKKEEAV